MYKRYYYDYQRRTMNPERIVPGLYLFLFAQSLSFPVGKGSSYVVRCDNVQRKDSMDYRKGFRLR